MALIEVSDGLFVEEGFQYRNVYLGRKLSVSPQVTDITVDIYGVWQGEELPRPMAIIVSGPTASVGTSNASVLAFIQTQDWAEHGTFGGY